MNIKHYLSAGAAIALLAACSNYDPGMSNNSVDLTPEEEAFITGEYAVTFVNRMGGVDENHTWGFPSEESASVKTRSVNVANNNQWITLVKDNQDDRDLVDIQYVDDAPTPGFPSATDGLFHIYQGNTPVTKTYDEIVTMVHNGTDEVNPVGDVTDEEIMYVSAWFRNNKNPQSDPLNVTNFYTQCISKDCDRTSYASEDGLINEGQSNWAEGDGVGAWDKNIAINWYKEGTLSTVDNNGQDATNKYSQEEFHLDQLGVKASNDNDYVHIYNNNAGNTSKISSENPTAINTATWSALTSDSNPNMGIVSDQSYRSIMYMNESGTTDFRAWSSGGSEWEYRWVLKHLTFTGRDGQNYDGWYLAFDMKYEKILTEQDFWDAQEEKNHHWVEKEEKDYDGYYSNYIVKITPGNGTVPPPAKQWYRIMCEDLGNAYDFDFNDIVFDVNYAAREDGKYDATVVLQAAGGTLPIYLGQFDAAHEAHYMLSRGTAPTRVDGTYKPINVADASDRFATAEPYTFTMVTTTKNPDDIDIYVSNIGNKGTRVVKLPKSGTVTSVPMKICIPDQTTRWMRENQQIEETYTYFRYWVQNENSEYNFGQSKAWNKNGLENTGRLW